MVVVLQGADPAHGPAPAASAAQGRQGIACDAENIENGFFVSIKCQYSAVQQQGVVRNSLQIGDLPISRRRVYNPLPLFFARVDCRAAWC